MTLNFRFDNSYARLPEQFYVRQTPFAAPAPSLIALNHPLAGLLGLDGEKLASEEGIAALCGKALPPDAEPIAMAYAGHQFGHFVPQLGDGRALLIGEIIGRDGIRRDLQLKGAGRTAFSRQGDGRAALGPVLREYLLSEAMAALGVPTTRALAALTTGDEIWRDGPVKGALLVRVAQSHVRIGTFQYFAARGEQTALTLLADHVIARNYPELATAENPYLGLLHAVIRRQGELVAKWLLLGFVHGVMNTDNMSIAGETIDYGPCAFLDSYHPFKVFSSIDSQGRYAYGRQPQIAAWNLARLAETLLFLLGPNEEVQTAEANGALASFAGIFATAYQRGLCAKLGLDPEEEADVSLAQDLLARMAEGKADYTLVFRSLCDAAEDPDCDRQVRTLFAEPELYDEWARNWHERFERGRTATRLASLRAANPRYIPRNHRVEAALKAAQKGDFSDFQRLLQVLQAPYAEQPEFAEFATPPLADEEVCQTFCGT